MKNTKLHYSPNKQKLNLSYYSTIICGEKLFGNPENDEPNIAFSILKCLESIDVSCVPKICQNIMLSGGVVSMNNFHSRLRQEILYFFNETNLFDKIKNILPLISFTSVIYPSNILNWVGASIMGAVLH